MAGTTGGLVRATGALALAVMLLAGCSSEPVAEEASPTPTPSPTFEVHPVVGERVPSVFHLSSREILGNGERTPLDDEAVAAVINAVSRFLDGHLDDLQRGGPGALADVAADGLLDDGDVALATTDLTDPDRPVKSARYHIAVYGDVGLEWTSARIEVTHPDDEVVSATFVFAIDDDGGLRLVQAGPEDVGGGA